MSSPMLDHLGQAVPKGWTRQQPLEHGWYWFICDAFWVLTVIRIDEEGVWSIGSDEPIEWQLQGRFRRLDEPATGAH